MNYFHVRFARMKKEYNYPLRLPIAMTKLLRKEAKARRWSLNTYINYLVATHSERVPRTNNEEGA